MYLVLLFVWDLCLCRIRDSGLYGKEDSNEKESVPKNRRKYEDSEGESRTTWSTW